MANTFLEQKATRYFSRATVENTCFLLGSSGLSTLQCLTIDLSLPNCITVSQQCSNNIKHPDKVVVRLPDQHDNNDSDMNYRSTDENRNSPSVLGEAAKRQRKKRVSGSKADHHKPNTMDSKRTCHEGLRKTRSNTVLLPLNI